MLTVEELIEIWGMEQSIINYISSEHIHSSGEQRELVTARYEQFKHTETGEILYRPV